MDTVKTWIAGALAGCLVLVTAAWFLLIAPVRSEAAALQDQAATQEQANASLRAQLAVLQQQAEQLHQEEAALAAVAEKVPADAGLPALVRALDDLSARTGVELVTVAPGAVAPAGGAAPADPAAAAAAPPAPWSVLPLNLDVVGGFYDVQAFLAGLEDLTRAVRVTSLRLAPGANPVLPTGTVQDVDSGRTLAVNLTAEAYVAPGTTSSTLVVPAPAASAAVAAPAPAGGTS